MAVEICLTSNGVLPKMHLPDGGFASTLARSAARLSCPFLFQVALFPAQRVIRIFFWQQSDAVDMLRQQANRIDAKGETLLYFFPG